MFASCPMVYHERKGKHARFFNWCVGHFYWTVDPTDGQRFLWMKLPRLDSRWDGSPCIIPVRPTQDSPSWGWDGNLERPTLTPSVFHDPNSPQSPHHWHGWITNGQMVGC